eukprot:10216039-Karenia_brevis.AAC.1
MTSPRANKIQYISVPPQRRHLCDGQLACAPLAWTKWTPELLKENVDNGKRKSIAKRIASLFSLASGHAVQ